MDFVRLKHDNVSELPLRSVSKAYKHKGLQSEVPLAQRRGEVVCTAHDPHGIGDCGIHRLWRLNVLCVHGEEKRGGGGGRPLPFMAVWELETLETHPSQKAFYSPSEADVWADPHITGMRLDGAH